MLKKTIPSFEMDIVSISVSGSFISETDVGISTAMGSSGANFVVSIKNVTSKNARSTMGVMSIEVELL
jgi:hypothetical protein